MNPFKNSLVLALLCLVLADCKSKKPSLAGDEPVEISDFIEFFPGANLPFLVTDSSLGKKPKDSLLISYKVFNQFIPDSLMNKVFSKGVKPKLYPLGKTTEDGVATYLFARAIAGEKKAVFVFAFDKKDQLMDGMPLLIPDNQNATIQSANMDKGYSIYKTVTRKNPDGSFSEGKDVYGLNKESRRFMLIMTDALDDKLTELINPIDTFARKSKIAGDYISGKMNLVSIRDARRSGRLNFFIHFEKSGGECTGELKGEAIIKSPTLAEYRLGGDPCVLQFTFNANSVMLKELEGCGAHRGLRCSFDGSFQRKKDAKAKPVKKKNPVKSK